MCSDLQLRWDTDIKYFNEQIDLKMIIMFYKKLEHKPSKIGILYAYI